jgi:uncharacterized protein YggU (UPF0235/DUF167 family)
VLDVVAKAFNVRPAAVHLRRGATSRRKFLSIDGEEEALERKLFLLLGSARK